MAIFHRRGPQRPPSARPGVPVLLSPGLADLDVPLGQALGADFSVQTDGPGSGGVMIVGPVGPPGVAFLRISHPGVRLLVIDRRGSASPAHEAVKHLEAGADGFLSSPGVAEVAAHVRAVARRSRGARGTPATAA